MNQKPPKILYHYCSLNSLCGIIENRHLRMTNAFWMDDTTEVSWFCQVVARVLEKRPLESRTALDKRFHSMMTDVGASAVFCGCFSGQRDSLSQWLEYADNGFGFAVGFDTEKFDLKRAAPKRDVELCQVIYDEKEQERIAEDLVKHLADYDDEVASSLSRGLTKDEAWREAPRYKSPAFENENEWRLIQRDATYSEFDFFARHERQLTPFVTFPFVPSKDPIREIWLGPRHQSQLNVDAVAALLRKYDYNVDHITFTGSNIPLRQEHS